jgi:hypothetical protein
VTVGTVLGDIQCLENGKKEMREQRRRKERAWRKRKAGNRMVIGKKGKTDGDLF